MRRRLEGLPIRSPQFGLRDKIAASRRKACGGNVPWGYEVRDRKLVVNEAEAAFVRSIFERFVATGSATVLAREHRQEGVRSNRGSVIQEGLFTGCSPTGFTCGGDDAAGTDEGARGGVGGAAILVWSARL